MRGWTAQDSADLYNIAQWGSGYFHVNDAGHVEVRPDGPGGGAIDLWALFQELQQRGIQPPLLLRFTEVLRARLEALNGAFEAAIRESGYGGRYRGVYPIKVNQQRTVVEDLVRFGRAHGMGLEAGSKPELLVVLALLDDPDALIVCNGYKDDQYIETALLAQKLGRRPIIVIEKSTEVDLVVGVAERLGIRPALGLRARLSRPGQGRWKTSAGERSKFGLTPRELVIAVDRLRALGHLDCLRMLHFHIGSQVTSIRPFKEAVREAARTYVELVAIGAPMGFFDVGGGLGVDYDGSRTDSESSINYSEQEYANDIVAGIKAACDRARVAPPDIITESGRALVAPHSALVFNILGVSTCPTDGPLAPLEEGAVDLLVEMRAVCESINRKTLQEAWHDALSLKEQGLTRFNLGLISLRDRARLEQLFWQACGRIRNVARSLDYVSDDLDVLERGLADIYYCNFSIFQSVPDAWAVKQLFPCLPLHRLAERPTRRAVLADITCDSDGKLDRFIGLRDVKDTLELHPWSPESPYVLGLFLVGAYQEILGDLHNLFGDTNTVQVSLGAGGRYRIDHVAEGDSVTDVLGYVQYNKGDLIRRVREASERALARGTITLPESRALLRAYRHGLEGYTYLEDE